MTMTILTEKMYSIKELSGIFDVSQETIRNWMQRGKNGVILEAIDVVGRIRVTQGDLDEFTNRTIKQKTKDNKSKNLTSRQLQKDYEESMQAIEKMKGKKS